MYSAAVLVLHSVLPGRLSVARAKPLCEALGIPKRTLERWRNWWCTAFVKTPLWIHGQARFMPAIEEKDLPGSILERFRGEDGEARLVLCLRFLATDPVPRAGHAR